MDFCPSAKFPNSNIADAIVRDATVASILHSSSRQRDRLHPQALLDASQLGVFLLQQIGGRSLQEELNSFFMALSDYVQCVRTVTKSAFGQARKKLNASAFSALNRIWVQGWHKSVQFACWHDHHVIAADGTCLRLPAWGENIDKYGMGPCADGSVAMVRCVVLYSVASQ